MAVLDFTKSGDKAIAKTITLADVHDTCLKFGFLMKDVPSSAPIGRRCDAVGLFKVLGCSSLSTFKKAFGTEKLPSPNKSMRPHVLQKDLAADEVVTWKEYGVAEFDRLANSFEDLKWKLVPKPGGQAVKTEDYYKVAAANKQVAEGDAPEEQPLWTDNGSVDYAGRMLFAEWNKLKGKTKDQAKAEFVYQYGRAFAESRELLNFRKY